MTEHEPWIGSQYEPGGLMLWGFSHHRESYEADSPDFTIKTIELHALTDDIRFFSQLRQACGGIDPEAFWQSVAFANTLPNAVEDKYSRGSREAREGVPERVKRIIEELQPGRTILFSHKGWPLWPELDGSYSEPPRPLAGAPIVEWGSYKISAPWETFAYDLPHPQFQSVRELEAAVSAIMAHRVEA